MRKGLALLLLLTACMSLPDNGDIEDATVYHWENEHATMEKFIADHKKCLGADKTPRPTRMHGLLAPMEPSNIPVWDSVWATFESRGYKEAGQRIAFSTPSSGTAGLHNYQTCMEGMNYRLTYMR